MDKLQIIDLLLTKYVQDPSTRAIQDGIPRYITVNNQTCPLGSVLKIKSLANIFGDIYTLVRMAALTTPGISYSNISYMPKGIVDEYYNGHQLAFWSDLIKFHDDNEHFNDKGLTEKGENFLKFIKLKWTPMKEPRQ